MIATSVYSPYVEQFYQIKEPRQPPKEPAPLTDGQRKLFSEPSKQLKEFTIKGHKVMAYSRKDAIKRLKHNKILKT